MLTLGPCPKVKCGRDCVVITRNSGCQQCACPDHKDDSDAFETLLHAQFPRLAEFNNGGKLIKINSKPHN